MTDPTDGLLPDTVIEEAETDSSLDEWTPDFPYPADGLPQHVRVDSRRWLLLPDRYVVRPLRAMEAAKAADALASLPTGKAFLGLAARLRAQREGIAEMLRADPIVGQLDEDGLQEQVDLRMVDHAQVGTEELLGEGRVEPFAWALPWLERCHARRVPLPSRREGPDQDKGGLVHAATGAAAWHTYYAGRQVHVLRLAAACCWLSLGPFFFDLRTSR